MASTTSLPLSTGLVPSCTRSEAPDCRQSTLTTPTSIKDILVVCSSFTQHITTPVMLSPRGIFGLGLGLEALDSASNIWSRPGLDLVVLLCNRALFGQKSCKIREFCYFFLAIILNCMLLIITVIWYFFHNYFCLGLGLNLQKLASASASASRFWPRLTSLHNTYILTHHRRHRVPLQSHVPCRPFDLFVKFLPREALQCKARSCDRMSSVRLSVTLVDCDHIGWNSSKIISRLVSVGRSLSAECRPQHQGPTPRGATGNLGPK